MLSNGIILAIHGHDILRPLGLSQIVYATLNTINSIDVYLRRHSVLTNSLCDILQTISHTLNLVRF